MVAEATVARKAWGKPGDVNPVADRVEMAAQVVAVDHSMTAEALLERSGLNGLDDPKLIEWIERNETVADGVQTTWTPHFFRPIVNITRPEHAIAFVKDNRLLNGGWRAMLTLVPTRPIGVTLVGPGAYYIKSGGKFVFTVTATGDVRFAQTTSLLHADSLLVGFSPAEA